MFWAIGNCQNGEAPFSVIGLDRPILHKELPKLSLGYDFVFLDGAPRVSDLIKSKRVTFKIRAPKKGMTIKEYMIALVESELKR